MLGNEAAKRTISTFFDAITSTGEVRFPFLIMQWESGTGVVEYILSKVGDLVWWYKQDVLLLRDMSGRGDIKRHTLKVDVEKKDQLIESDTFGPVANSWARDISQRLSLSPAGNLKIVLIENIHRMTTSAANALLKSFEEPLPGRLIIWTTTNVRTLLDTIVSRAFLVQTVSPDMELYIKTHYENQKEKWLVQRAIALVGYDQEQLETLLADEILLSSFGELETEIFNKWAGFRIAWLAKELTKHRTTEKLLNAMMIRADQHSKFDLVQQLLFAKRQVWANVNSDHVRFGLGIDKS